MKMSFDRKMELENALTDATRTARIVSDWMAHSIGFENREPPTLSEENATNIYWAVTTVAHLISEADRIFHEPEKKEGA